MDSKIAARKTGDFNTKDLPRKSISIAPSAPKIGKNTIRVLASLKRKLRILDRLGQINHHGKGRGGLIPLEIDQGTVF